MNIGIASPIFCRRLFPLPLMCGWFAIHTIPRGSRLVTWESINGIPPRSLNRSGDRNRLSIRPTTDFSLVLEQLPQAWPILTQQYYQSFRTLANEGRFTKYTCEYPASNQ